MVLPRQPAREQPLQHPPELKEPQKMIEFLKPFWSAFENAGAAAEQAAVASEECATEDHEKTPVFAGKAVAEPWDVETAAGPAETSVAAVAGASEVAVYEIDGAKDAMARSPAR